MAARSQGPPLVPVRTVVGAASADGRPKPTTRRRSRVKDLIAQYHHDESLCRYKNKLCLNPRARKRRGGLHTFCEMHREAANRNQRRLDQRKRVQKRQLETGVLLGINPIITASEAALSVDEDSDCSSPLSPATMVDTEMRSPGSDTRVASSHIKRASPCRLDLEPSRTPVALQDEDIYALRWLFAVDETTKQHAADVEMGSCDAAATQMQWT